ncbi:hypothetical protein CTI12_AA560980 [Artemisia annua]|uniref:Uncharacterized protein n=1 Tax=Artemisia annua TaxID=35608 RepID=A0A2U1KV81_ARTAN|nr:hypothetical protein CTI12_AA560980 [Artemisia annua]
MVALRENQAGLEPENTMTDEAILGEVLGTRRGFNPRRVKYCGTVLLHLPLPHTL